MSEVFVLMMDLAKALGIKGLNTLPGAWVHKIDDRWTMACNGKKEPQTVEPEGCMSLDLPPYQAAFWWNGWLAGIVGVDGGTIAAHPTGANEDRLIADMRKAIAEASKS